MRRALPSLSAVWPTSVALLVAIAGAPATATAYRYVHVVLPGEKLRQIAKRYHVTPRRIRRLNRLRGDLIRSGQRLKIVTSVPSRTRRRISYTIKRGDTLSRLAKRFRMKLWLLRRLNRRALRRRGLRPGQKLSVVVEGPAPGAGVKGLYRLETSPAYKVRNRSRAWGTFLAVTRIHDVLTAYASRFAGARALVYDLSRRGGGYFRRIDRTGPAGTSTSLIR